MSDSTTSESDLSLDNVRIKRYNFNPNSDPNSDPNLLDSNFNFFAIDSLTNIEFNSSSNQLQRTSGSLINSKSIIIDKDNTIMYIIFQMINWFRLSYHHSANLMQRISMV